MAELKYPFAWPTGLGYPKELESVHDEPLVLVELPSGDEAWLVTRYEDIRAVLADPTVSKNRNRPGVARMTKDKGKVFHKQVDMDPPGHTRMRRLIGRAFTAHRIEAFRPRIQEITDGILDDLECRCGPFDLHRDFSRPLTIKIICELLGVPEDDQEKFGDTSRPPWGYMKELIERKRAEPDNALISALIEVSDADGDRLSEEELHWWSTLLLLAGYETTASQVSGCTVLLLESPELRDRFIADGADVHAFVEELLRCQLVGSSLSMLRLVTEDIEIGGVRVPKGSSVIPALEVGNFDPAAFGCPHAIDFDRAERPQLTFSIGQHYCVGAPLARAELQIAISSLLRRLPGLRLTVPFEALERQEDLFFQGFTQVPVAWSSPYERPPMQQQNRCPYPFVRPGPLDPPRELAGLREQPTAAVTLPSGDEALLVTRYADVRKLLTDDRLSRNLSRPGAARISKNNQMFQDQRIDPDPPNHTRVRRLVMSAFTPARVEAMRPFVEKTVAELLDAMERDGGPADLNQALAFPLPIRVLCELIGVPVQDIDRFRDWTDHFLSVGKYTGPEIGAAMRGLTGYIGALIEAKRAEPTDDLISDMIKVRDEEDGRLEEYELQWWCRLLLLVGYETTATQIGGGVALLLAHPGQLDKLKGDWSLLPGAVEEMLRWKLVGSSVSMLRYAIDDITMDGYTIPKGTSVIPAVDSANLDESVFPDPLSFDITRDASRQLTFSAGPHFCIGANLARLEIQVATEALFRRFPGLRLTVRPGELKRQEGALLEGFVELPVTW